MFSDQSEHFGLVLPVAAGEDIRCVDALWALFPAEPWPPEENKSRDERWAFAPRFSKSVMKESGRDSVD